jgi:hypothetical protein
MKTLSIQPDATETFNRGCFPTQAESQATQENPTPPVGDVVAQALNRMADVVQNITRSEHREEHRAKLGKDLTLELFLKFRPPLYQRKPDIEREAKTRIEQIEDIFVVLNYLNKRNVQFAAFDCRTRRDWWIWKKETREMEQRAWVCGNFVTKFMEQFIPRWIIEMREDDFYNCKQEGKTVGTMLKNLPDYPSTAPCWYKKSQSRSDVLSRD